MCGLCPPVPPFRKNCCFHPEDFDPGAVAELTENRVWLKLLDIRFACNTPAGAGDGGDWAEGLTGRVVLRAGAGGGAWARGPPGRVVLQSGITKRMG